VRSERALEAAVEYVHMNPVKAGMVERMENYPWSSAYAVRSAASWIARPAGLKPREGADVLDDDQARQATGGIALNSPTYVDPS
jgi:hypothetical protein